MRLFSCFIATWILASASLWADERILSFHSDISVYRNGEMTVAENIDVRSQGQAIRRGIYRDFPTRYKDRYGNNYVVDFQVIAVERDGRREPWHIEKRSNGVRVYIGTENKMLPHGQHSYRLTYRTNRQLGFFDDHDELYWNVTGNGWEFPIDEVSATVSLPAEVGAEGLSLKAFTGLAGSDGEDYRAHVDAVGRAYFESTRGLASTEGLTIVASWPVGHINRPDTGTRITWFFQDNASLLVGSVGTLVVLVFYYFNWQRSGRDPDKGTIIPLYNPPEKLSPAAMRYVLEMSFDDKVLAAAIISMAVKGYLDITESHGDYSLKKTGKVKAAGLSTGEKALAKKLFANAESITLKNINHSVIGAAVKSLKNHLKAEFHQTYFKTNRSVVVVGAILSLLTILLSGVMGTAEPVMVVFSLVWLSVWTGGTVGLWFSGNRFMAAVFCLAEVMAIGLLGAVAGYGFVGGVVVLLGINGLFYALMAAPTRRGRTVMDAIEGFRMYLSTAEQERLNLLHPPDRTPELFEKYLPYALALGVDQQWAEQFSEVLAKAGADQQSYAPGWYHGNNWHRLGANDFGSALGVSLGSAISSSSHAPGSSSGSGGSSGGGGGGGGGGGW